VGTDWNVEMIISFLIFFGVAFFGWGFGSTVAWYDYRMSNFAPFNWRIYLGPVVYINWVESLGE